MEICCDPEDISIDPTREIPSVGHTKESTTKDPFEDSDEDVRTTHKSATGGHFIAGTTKKSVNVPDQGDSGEGDGHSSTKKPEKTEGRVSSKEEGEEGEDSVTKPSTHSVPSPKKPETKPEEGSEENVSKHSQDDYSK